MESVFVGCPSFGVLKREGAGTLVSENGSSKVNSEKWRRLSVSRRMSSARRSLMRRKRVVVVTMRMICCLEVELEELVLIGK